MWTRRNGLPSWPPPRPTDWRWVLGGTSRARARSVPGLDETTAEKITDFFDRRYRKLMALALFLGATQQEAEDAVSAAMEEMVRRWHEIRDPVVFARRAVVSNLIKAKERPRQLATPHTRTRSRCS
jgi:DNA-directed RNA polymerase specialized sigma24 family protein